jgi:hypothetical protein
VSITRVNCERSPLTMVRPFCSDSPYIAPDGTLHARFEGRLAKPESECVIC